MNEGWTPEEREEQRTHIRIEGQGSGMTLSRHPVPEVPAELRQVEAEELALEGRLLE